MAEKIVMKSVVEKAPPATQRWAAPGGHRLSDFAEQAGISVSYASQLLSNNHHRRNPTIVLALDIYHKTGVKLGLLVGASRAEINTVARMVERTGLAN